MNTNSDVRNSHPCPKRRRAAAGGGAALVQDAASWTGGKGDHSAGSTNLVAADWHLRWPLCFARMTLGRLYLQNVPSMARVAAGAFRIFDFDPSSQRP